MCWLNLCPYLWFNRPCLVMTKITRDNMGQSDFSEQLYFGISAEDFEVLKAEIIHV